MTDEGDRSLFQDVYDAMPVGATYALMITGPKFAPVPDVGTRIRVRVTGPDNASSWEYAPDGPSLVTKVERHGMTIVASLKRV